MVRENKEMLSLGVFSQIPYRGRLAALTIGTVHVMLQPTFLRRRCAMLRHLLNILHFDRDF